MADDVKLVRSIGMIGQGGAGKTSVADGLLFSAGATTRVGHVDDGSSLFDFEPEEIRHKTTLSTTAYSFPWKKHAVTLLDMPGYSAFLNDTITCMRACTGLVFVAAAAPHELRVEAERMWERSQELGLPVLAFLTRMDRERADHEAALADLRGILRARFVPIQLPIGTAENFRGTVDLLTMKARITQPDGGVKDGPLPDDIASQAAGARERMIELAAEASDEFTERYLENGTLTDEELSEALRLGTLQRRLVPVLYGAGPRAAGTLDLLDAVLRYLPSAAELGAVQGRDPRVHESVERLPDASEPFSALVFKTVVDPFAGKLSLLRVLSGRAQSDSVVANATRDTRERLGHLLQLTGRKQVQVDHAVAGEIVAVAKLKDTSTGDTLADEKAPILYPAFTLPPPAISFAVEPKSKGDDEKASLALARMMEEDPALEMHRDPQTHELILSGVGQQHIEIVIERLKRKYSVEVELKAPKVPYKETIKGRAEAQGKLKKQTGGRGQYGDAWLRVEPLPRGAGFEFVDAVKGGVVPRQYIPAVEKGVREALQEGVLARCPVVDVRVTLYDGSYHDVDSSEMAFKIAAGMGFRAAALQAHPILLEPVMSMEVAVPDDCMGDVIGDLNGRRGKVLGVDAKPNGQAIRAQVPMSEVLKYSPDLRSMTSGRGSFTIAFSHYEELPGHLAEKVIRDAGEVRSHAHE